jgi:heme/copper-type cytochrome/quinol oxidase subunit 2
MPIAAATHTSNVFWFLPLLGLLLIGVVMFRWSRRAKTTTTRRLDEVERELATVQSQILLVTTSAVPGGRTVRTLGYVEALSDTEAASDWEYRLAEKQALLGLARQGLGIGANAIVGVRKSNAHYDQAGSKWRVARVTYAGTAVVVNQRFQSTEWAAS